MSYGDNKEEPGFHEAWFYLQNHGRGAARQPAVLIHDAPGALEWEAKEWDPAWAPIGQVGTAISTDAGWRASADVIIFPGQRVTVATVPVRHHVRTPRRMRLHGFVYHLDGAPFEWSLNAEFNGRAVYDPALTERRRR